ncbi:transcriptional regulator [Bhargavaea cecembensis]|uniref:Transcriptional regulator n=2 Tax=Bhargavaea cecembensis TaxID=394098 RepID=A0A161RGQ4_9BACL|nr:transcriptional regulator [Bhargavaea cecembensis]
MKMMANKARLRDVFELPTDQTMKIFHDRLISIPVTALSALKRELVASIGEDRAKGVFIRYGWHTGVSEGEKVRNFEWKDETELVEAGPKFHVIHGYLDEVIVDDIRFDEAGHVEYVKALWSKSYEADEYKQTKQLSDEPVCHTLCGYASGYLSTALQKPILVKETKCEAMGHERCEIVCMPVEKWDEEDRNEYRYYQSSSMIKELDEVTAKLKTERDYLTKANDIHKQLIKELLSKQELHKITELLYGTTGLPTFIEDEKHRVISRSGDIELNLDLKALGTDTTCFTQLSHGRGILRTPILFENEIKGFCSFVYQNGEEPTELERMIIDQASLTSSIILMNENIKLQTEQNIRRSFLNDILDEKMDKEELYQVARYLELDLESDYWMLTLERNIDETDLRTEVEISEKLLRHLNLFLKERGITAIVSHRSGNILIVIDYSSCLNCFADRTTFINKLLKHCEKRFKGESFYVGASSVADSLEELPVLYSETLTALNAKSDDKWILYYEELGVESILFQISNEKTLDRFVDNQLGTLLEEDKSLELITTLRDYIENGMNINATAKAISMSISGLRYRLGKISELLDVELDDTKRLFSVYMALNVLKAKGKI